MRNSLFAGCLLASVLQADSIVKAKYTTDGKVTEVTAYANATRQRFESGPTDLIQQCDRQRAIQVDKEAKTFVVLPLKTVTTGSTPAAAADCAGKITSADTGERRVMLGLTAARYRTLAEGCQGQSASEIDGWYIGLQNQATCSVGAISGPGFPLAYTVTTRDDKGTPQQMQYEVTSFQMTSTPLDAALFEAPPGLTEQSVAQASAIRNPAYAEAVQKPKVNPRVGVASPGYMPLDNRLIASLKDPKFEFVPLGGGEAADIESRAASSKVDYILYAELTGVKRGAEASSSVSKKLSGVSRLTSGGPAKETIDAIVNYRLASPGSAAAPRLAATATGSNINFNLKDAINLARFASQFMMPMSMLTSGGTGGSGLFKVMQILQQSSSAVSSVDSNMMAFSSAMNSAGGTSLSSEEDAAVSAALDKVGKAVIANLQKPEAVAKNKKTK